MYVLCMYAAMDIKLLDRFPPNSQQTYKLSQCLEHLRIFENQSPFWRKNYLSTSKQRLAAWSVLVTMSMGPRKRVLSDVCCFEPQATFNKTNE